MQSILEDTRPKKTKAVRSSAEVIAAIQAVSISSRTIFANIRGARLDLGDLEQTILAEGGNAGCMNGSQLVYKNQPVQGRFLSILDIIQRAAACRHFLDLLENSPEGKTAEATLQPLFDELATAQERERIDEEKANAARQDLLNAREAALADLQAQVDNHPLVVEAAKKCEPFRRLGQLVEE
jgi:hypothetical protein